MHICRENFGKLDKRKLNYIYILTLSSLPAFKPGTHQNHLEISLFVEIDPHYVLIN